MEIKFTTDRVAKIQIGISYVQRNLRKQLKILNISVMDKDEKMLLREYLQEQIDECNFMYEFFSSMRQRCTEESTIIFQNKPREFIKLQDLIREPGHSIST